MPLSTGNGIDKLPRNVGASQKETAAHVAGADAGAIQSELKHSKGEASLLVLKAAKRLASDTSNQFEL